MTNTELLEAKIKESGKKKGYLAKKIGLSYGGFSARIKNKFDFTTTQVDTLCKELGITSLKEKEAVFFAC